MAHGNKKESYEIGTDEYREYTQELTPSPRDSEVW